MNKVQVSVVALCAAALASCGGATEGTRNSVRAVGSSTVYPFAKLVAENFVRSNSDFASPIIESTGTGGGIQLFCKGVGANTPDIANASRRMKASELADCQKNGVTEVTEIQVGLDGIAFASAMGGIDLNLTPEIVYRALAARPNGKPQTAKTWADVDPSLPAKRILVYGPPSTSGTRDALKELVLIKGCEANAEMKALKDSDEDKHEQLCTELRDDGAYVDQGEQDNLIVQKIGGNRDAVGVFGFSYLEENADKVQGLRMNGVEPTYENIASFKYPGARPLFLYVKNAHLDAIRGLREFVAEWSRMWGKEGPLTAIGLVSNPDDVAAKSKAAVTDFTPLAAADLK
jgi:phosphate transport system substrate-binding protein